MTTKIYFCTNRKPNRKSNPTRFGKHFSHDGLANLRFGLAEVTDNGYSLNVAKERLVHKHDGQCTDHQKSVLGSLELFSGLRHQMKEHHQDTIVFIHGYNVDFSEALDSAAKLARNFSSLHDGQGVNVVLFSWPSDGSMMPWLAYSNDRRDAAASGPAFARGILKLAEFLRSAHPDEVCEQRIHLVAHSMGNYVLRHALQEILHQCSGALPRLFDEIFLMAADEDDDAFEHAHKLMRLPRLARRVNVYFNRGDKAMAVSDMTKGNPDRLGDDGPRAPFQVPAKVVQVDCTRVTAGLVQHSYFVDEKRVVRDMARVLKGEEDHLIEGREFLRDRNRYVISD